MESFRLKNIAIVILLLLNGFLLLLLGWQFMQTQEEKAETVRQLHALYTANQLELTVPVEKLGAPLDALTLTRNTETEKRMAAKLLGDDVISLGMGGGIYDYGSDAGVIHFRAAGSFDGVGLSREVDDPRDFASRFCRDLGYKDMEVTRTGEETVIAAIQYAADMPVQNCGVILKFRGNTLTAVSGTHVSLENAVIEEGELLSGVTALLRFLDYRNAAGVVCAEVSDISCVYELQGSALRLTPSWQVETDAHEYLVDCATGEVTRR